MEASIVTCPWCGTHYQQFQSNCKNCGGPLAPPPRPAETDSPATYRSAPPAVPPPAPRPISNRYAWRLLSASGPAIVAFVFLLLGVIFSFVGFPLTIALVTAFVGIPFAILGLVFLGVGMVVGRQSYLKAQKTVECLREGEAVIGLITSVEENRAVMINNQHPWTIAYQFQLDGHTYEGQVSTLTRPSLQHAEGRQIYVLYLPDEPQHNAIYPHP
jgi:hypothetical protein